MSTAKTITIVTLSGVTLTGTAVGSTDTFTTLRTGSGEHFSVPTHQIKYVMWKEQENG